MVPENVEADALTAGGASVGKRGAETRRGEFRRKSRRGWSLSRQRRRRQRVRIREKVLRTSNETVVTFWELAVSLLSFPVVV